MTASATRELADFYEQTLLDKGLHPERIPLGEADGFVVDLYDSREDCQAKIDAWKSPFAEDFPRVHDALKDALIKASILIHVMRPVPCTIDGESAVLPMDTYVYRTRYLASRDLMEVVTLDGTVALIAFTLEGETYLIDGVPQTEYFDNLGW